jgi:hypothetical protein
MTQIINSRRYEWDTAHAYSSVAALHRLVAKSSTHRAGAPLQR